jgi:hypothetical protein
MASNSAQLGVAQLGVAQLGASGGPASPSAYAGTAITIQPYTAAELHPHTFPPSILDSAPLLLTATYVVVRQSFSYHRSLADRRVSNGSPVGHDQTPETSKT